MFEAVGSREAHHAWYLLAVEALSVPVGHSVYLKTLRLYIYKSISVGEESSDVSTSELPTQNSMSDDF